MCAFWQRSDRTAELKYADQVYWFDSSVLTGKKYLALDACELV